MRTRTPPIPLETPWSLPPVPRSRPMAPISRSRPLTPIPRSRSMTPIPWPWPLTFTRSRPVPFPISIAVSWFAFISWSRSQSVWFVWHRSRSETVSVWWFATRFVIRSRPMAISYWRFAAGAVSWTWSSAFSFSAIASSRTVASSWITFIVAIIGIVVCWSPSARSVGFRTYATGFVIGFAPSFLTWCGVRWFWRWRGVWFWAWTWRMIWFLWWFFYGFWRFWGCLLWLFSWWCSGSTFLWLSPGFQWPRAWKYNRLWNLVSCYWFYQRLFTTYWKYVFNGSHF